MFSFFPPLLIIIGLVGLIFLFNQQQSKKSSEFIRKLFFSFKGKKQSRFQSWSLTLIERLLVHLRITILKLDRFLSNNLSRLRKKRMLGKNQEEKEFSFSLPSLNKKGKASSFLGTDFPEEEKKLLHHLEKLPDDRETLMNLARIYLWKEDFSSARGILLQAYRKNKEDRITQTLLVELKEKEENWKAQKNKPE